MTAGLFASSVQASPDRSAMGGSGRPRHPVPAQVIRSVSMQSRKTVNRHWQLRLHDIVFENDTPAGKAFDIAVLVSILLSVLVVLLESVASIRQAYGGVLRVAE